MTSDFKLLQAEWRTKLRESGFVDLEDEHGAMEPEKITPSNVFRVKDQDVLNALLREHTFERPQDAEILSLHLEGKSYREVARILGISKDVVYRAMARIRKAATARP